MAFQMREYDEGCEDTYRRILYDGLSMTKVKKWLGDFRIYSKNLGISRVHIFQTTFASYACDRIHADARLLRTLMESSASKNTDSDLSVQHCPVASQSPLQHRDYNKNFPSLHDTALEKQTLLVQKSKRRINPTPISSEGSSKGFGIRNNKNYNYNNEKEELYSRRFLSKEESHLKKTDHFTHAQTKTITYKSDIGGIHEVELLADLYNSILANSLVNIIAELKFVLNIFNTVCDHNSNSFIRGKKSLENHSGLFNVLTDCRKWEYFCIKIFIEQQDMLINILYITRMHIATKLSQFKDKYNIPATFDIKELDAFIHKMQENTNLPCNDVAQLRSFTNHVKTGDDFNSEKEYMLYLEGQRKFVEEQEKFNTYTSDDEIKKSLEFLGIFDSSILLIDSFGILFLQHIIITTQKSSVSKTDANKKKIHLNRRLFQPLSNDKDYDVFLIDELYFKHIIDYCFSYHPYYLFYIRHRIFEKIVELSKDAQEKIDDSMPVDMKQLMLFDIKMKIVLSKFLGYIDFYQRDICNNKIKINKKEEEILLSIYNEAPPPSDIKYFLVKAAKIGQFTITVPWIIQYLCMADNITAKSAYYADIIFILISLYFTSHQQRSETDPQKIKNRKAGDLIKLSLKIPDGSAQYTDGWTVFIKKSSLIFLKISISKLFDSKAFGESWFFDAFRKYSWNLGYLKYKDAPSRCIDRIDLIDQQAYAMLCPHFFKMKYWESSNAATIRNIRPSLIDSESEEKENNMEMKIEEQFLNDNDSINSLISFVISRISNIFNIELSSILEQDELYVDQGDTSKLAYQRILSDSSKNSISDLIMDCKRRVIESMIPLLPPNLPELVSQTSLSICLRKINEVIDGLISSKGLVLNNWVAERSITEPCEVTVSYENTPNCLDSLSKNEGTCLHHAIDNDEEPLSDLFSKVNISIRKIATSSSCSSQQNMIASVINDFKKMGEKLTKNHDENLLKDAYVLSWNFILHLIIDNPGVVSHEVIVDMCYIWKMIQLGANDQYILCPRVIIPAAKKDASVQKNIAIKIGSLIANVLDLVLSRKDLEAQCAGIFQHTWSQNELKLISLICSKMIDALTPMNIDQEICRLINFIDTVGEQANAMLGFETA